LFEGFGLGKDRKVTRKENPFHLNCLINDIPVLTSEAYFNFLDFKLSYFLIEFNNIYIYIYIYM
jgi:hypothetical protein